MTESPLLTETTDAAVSEPAPEGQPPTIQLGLVVTPVLSAETVQDLGQSVALELRRRFPDVSWDVNAVHDALVTPPASLTEVVDAARETGWGGSRCGVRWSPARGADPVP